MLHGEMEWSTHRFSDIFYRYLIIDVIRARDTYSTSYYSVVPV